MKKLLQLTIQFLSLTVFSQTTIYTNDFSNPSSWTISSQAGTGAWVIGTAIPSGSYLIDPIASTTAANGYALFDSDVDCSGNQITSLTLTGSVNCSIYPSVVLEFQQQYRRFDDSTFVFVSNNNGATWVKYPVNANFGNNDFSAANPEIVKVNISPTAGGQANVKVRFQFWSPSGSATAPGCGYSWMIDDVKLKTPPSYELLMTELFHADPFNDREYGTYPLSQVRPISLVAIVRNEGAFAQNASINYTITRGGVTVNSGSSNTFNIQPFTNDTVIIATGYTSNVIGNYSVAATVTSSNTDSDPTNNSGTSDFVVSNYVYSGLTGLTNAVAYTYSGASTLTVWEPSKIAHKFKIFNNATLNAIDIAVSSASTDNTDLIIEIFDEADLTTALSIGDFNISATHPTTAQYSTVSFAPVNLLAGHTYVASMSSEATNKRFMFYGVAGDKDNSTLVNVPDANGVLTWLQSDLTPAINLNFQNIVSFGTLTNNGISNNNPNPITFNTNPTGCSSFTYQWYSASGVVSAPTGTSTLGWTLIPGANSTSYDPPTLFSSTSYACFVTPLSACGSAAWASGVVSYTVTTSLGTITANGYSSSNNPAALSFSSITSGCPSFSYQWYSISGVISAPSGSSTSGWTLIPGATSNTYDPPTLYNSTSYACFVTPLSACGNAAWAGGVASFNITTSSGSVNGQQVSQCTSSAVPLTFDSQPVGLGNTTVQWYFANGAVSCPQGNSTSGWSPIASATSSTSSFIPPSSGTYTLACLVTPEGITGLPSQWANGCKSVVVNSFTSQSIIGNPNITPFNPYTYLVSQVSGHTYSWTAYGGAVSSGQNTNQVSIIWAATGPYQVMLLENNGVCSDTSYLDVVGASCALTVNVISIDPTTFCANGQARLIANSSSGVSYQWKLDGTILPGQTNDTLLATASGSYQVVAVLDASCSAISQPISLTELPSLTAPQITLNGSPSSCNSVAPTLTANGNYATFLWSTGEISQSITPTASGNYSVSVSDINGCTAQSIPQVVNLALLPPVDICVVSVDSLTGHNIVVWEKPFTTLIDSFVVFRESVVANVYEPIGTQAYGDFSTFIDPLSNPLAQASRYKLGLVDTCGTLSSTSDMHKTMHLTLNLGVGGTVNLIWSGYEGINFGSYKIYRGTAPDNMSLLITIQSSLNSYTDLTPPSGTVYYQLEIVIPGCNPTAFGFLSSRSNIANTGTIGFEQLNSDNVLVFPNPTDVGFTIQSRQVKSGTVVQLYDQMGRMVLSDFISGESTYMNTSVLASGIYLLRMPEYPGFTQKISIQ